MKKHLILSLLLVLGLSGISFAALSKTTSVTVTVQYLSVDIQGTPAFSTVAAASTFNLADTSCTVVNDGNWASDWSLKCDNSAPTAWTPTAGAAPAANTEFRLCAVFKSSAAITGDLAAANDYLNTGYRPSGADTTGAFYQVGAYGGGNNVSAAASKALWLSFCAPTGIPTATPQTITLYVQTAAH